MDIGLQIKKFREQQKISQEELALKIFVSRQTISNWETNKRILKNAIKPVLKKTVKISNSRLRPPLRGRTKPRAEILQETTITEQKDNKRNSPSIWSGLNRETKMSNMTVRQS